MKGTYPKNKAAIIALASLAWFGVLLQLFVTLHSTLESGRSVWGGLVGFFGYFTILTNLLVCISLTAPLLAPASATGGFFARSDVTAGVATSIVFVSLAYHFLLRNVWNPQGLQLLADVLLHYAMPVLFLAYWWFNFPKGALRWTHPLLWGLYPTLYLVYVLIRGRLIGTYPYGFIDPQAIGYERMMINALGLLGVFIVLGLVLIALGRLQRRAGA
ncbi:MAG TPA: Pr6Pr family membrane protein [Steroidobacteraceae bacterium]|nr:Pr6Pr family membrane protein [Steroidobacteraceae bacterium]